MTLFRGILILGRLRGESLDPHTSELIAAARRLRSKLGGRLEIILAGKDGKMASRQAVSLGLNRVHLVQNALFEEPHPGLWAALAEEAAQRIKPALILLTNDDLGRDAAPRLAAAINASVCLDCVQLDVDMKSQSLLQTKPVYGGKAMAVWASPLNGQSVVAMRPYSEKAAEPEPAADAEVKVFKTEIDNSTLTEELIETVEEEKRGKELEEARVVVAGGGGIGSSQGFSLLEELASLLHGALAITRVPADEGWMPSALEVGQTGHIVSPELYIAVGISGAPQHMAGCSRAKVIAAVNKDPEAHIFREADFGVIGDYKEVVPSLIEKIKSMLDA
ncbi:MAG: electron transfer flavoprotein subunit alpha/FixB family protein [Candidatus Aminicenantales bacterium]